MMATTSLLAVSTAATAHAATQVAIICGGTKTNSGWQTYPYGGYVGGNCGAGIDYVATPTDGADDYHFTPGPGTYQVQAWIPNVYATAKVGFAIYAEDQFNIYKIIDEMNFGAEWVTIGTITTGKQWVNVHAYLYDRSPGYYMGLDAVRLVH